MLEWLSSKRLNFKHFSSLEALSYKIR